jgi:hypothetical protein
MRVYSRRRERRTMRQALAYWRRRFNPYLSAAALIAIFMLAFTLTGGSRAWA